MSIKRHSIPLVRQIMVLFVSHAGRNSSIISFYHTIGYYFMCYRLGYNYTTIKSYYTITSTAATLGVIDEYNVSATGLIFHANTAQRQQHQQQRHSGYSGESV